MHKTWERVQNTVRLWTNAYKMFGTVKIVLIIFGLLTEIRLTDADTGKRDLSGQQLGIEFLQLGHFGPISRLSSHPTFAHLGLSPQQTISFVNVLYQNGLLSPFALKLANGQPLSGEFFGGQYGGNWLVPFGPHVDPYFLLLMANYAKFLPYGLGPQGFYGSTGLPKPRPLGVLSSCNEAVGELYFVILVFRHGDRAPVGPYPTDPHSDVSCWPNGWGQLTKLGKLQHYELGKWIRNRYWNFLPLRYNASDIYVQSTDVDRTLMSAYCNLAGIYECWCPEQNDGLQWQPVPVHTIPVQIDAVLAAHKKCPVYDQMLNEFLQSEEIYSINENYRDVFCNLSEHTGLQIKSARDCLYLYSTLNIQRIHGLKLPAWTKDYFPEPLQEIAEFAFKLPCYTAPLRRLKCGPLLKDILQHMEDKKAGKLTQKMWIYSGHDTTLANLMQCLNVYDGNIPPYTSMIIFELSKMKNDHFVKISYKTPTIFRLLHVPCCEKICRFHDFKRIVRPLIPCDWERECVK